MRKKKKVRRCRPKPPRKNGIALVTRQMKTQMVSVRRESFWVSAPRDGWQARVEAHQFPQVPYGLLLTSWTVEP